MPLSVPLAPDVALAVTESATVACPVLLGLIELETENEERLPENVGTCDRVGEPEKKTVPEDEELETLDPVPKPSELVNMKEGVDKTAEGVE